MNRKKVASQITGFGINEHKMNKNDFTTPQYCGSTDISSLDRDDEESQHNDFGTNFNFPRRNFQKFGFR
jgi:hypothetical protein